MGYRQAPEGAQNRIQAVKSLVGQRRQGEASLYETPAGSPGSRDEMLEVVIDPLRLEAYNVTAGELIQTVQNNNQLIAAGEVETAQGTFSVKIPSSFNEPRDVYNLPVKTNGDRVENKPALIALIEEVTTTKPTAHWIEGMEEAGIPYVPVQTIDQVAVHPQTEALGILREDEQGRAGYFGLPISFEGRRPDRNQPPPVLGQDDEA